jgi:hypothetical protein
MNLHRVNKAKKGLQKNADARTDGKASGLQSFVCLQEEHDACRSQGIRLPTYRHCLAMHCTALLLDGARSRSILEKQVPQATKSGKIAAGCGKTPAYPQDRMCRRPSFWWKTLFVHERCSLHTMFFQHIRSTVNP